MSSAFGWSLIGTRHDDVETDASTGRVYVFTCLLHGPRVMCGLVSYLVWCLLSGILSYLGCVLCKQEKTLRQEKKTTSPTAGDHAGRVAGKRSAAGR